MEQPSQGRKTCTCCCGVEVWIRDLQPTCCFAQNFEIDSSSTLIRQLKRGKLVDDEAESLLRSPLCLIYSKYLQKGQIFKEQSRGPYIGPCKLEIPGRWRSRIERVAMNWWQNSKFCIINFRVLRVFLLFVVILLLLTTLSLNSLLSFQRLKILLDKNSKYLSKIV